MSAVLIAVVLALVLGHAAPQLAQVRHYGWFRRWLIALGARFGASGFHGSRFGIVLSLGLPLLVVGLLQWSLGERVYGLPSFAFSLIVLFYCWGPRDLDLDVDAVVDAADTEYRRLAVRALLGPDREPTLDAPTLVEGVFAGALERWFGVLLWFVLLGPFGAMLYRLTQLGSTRDLGNELPLEHADAYRRLKLILDWPAAQLTVLGLALAANFDVVIGAWRRWHEDRGAGYFSLDTGFLGAAARVSVDCELAEELDEAYVADAVSVAPAPAMPALKDAMSLAWRVLLLWLVVLAIFVLAGFVN